VRIWGVNLRFEKDKFREENIPAAKLNPLKIRCVTQTYASECQILPLEKKLQHFPLFGKRKEKNHI
jgi:hypothetical protein